MLGAGVRYVRPRVTGRKTVPSRASSAIFLNHLSLVYNGQARLGD